jgi:hypothetical protein
MSFAPPIAKSHPPEPGDGITVPSSGSVHDPARELQEVFVHLKSWNPQDPKLSPPAA